MKGIKTLITTISILSLMSTCLAIAQPQMGNSGGGWRMGAQSSRMYNPSTVETITGEVIAVDRVSSRGGGSGGVHLRVATEHEEFVVHLGPAWYLDSQEIQIESGDRVEVTGSRVTVANTPTIIAAQVRRGDQVLALRDQNGFPVWHRSQR